MAYRPWRRWGEPARPDQRQIIHRNRERSTRLWIRVKTFDAGIRRDFSVCCRGFGVIGGGDEQVGSGLGSRKRTRERKPGERQCRGRKQPSEPHNGGLA